MTDRHAFGMVVIGDELLSGKRRDRHLTHVIEVLAARGREVGWCRYEGDAHDSLVEVFRQTRHAGVPVLCFGGIGATPDDRTRSSAAQAFDVPLVSHPQAVALIEQRFGAAAYPVRVRMAELPDGCTLIPNPDNQVPGFSLSGHHFFPGFPRMAWPMLDWVLDNYYPQHYAAVVESFVRVHGVAESDLSELMETLSRRHPQARLFSLPHVGTDAYIELGFRGAAATVAAAFSDLAEALAARRISFEDVDRVQ